MAGSRRSVRRGVRASDLPESVVRDLPEFVPLHAECASKASARRVGRAAVKATEKLLRESKPVGEIVREGAARQINAAAADALKPKSRRQMAVSEFDFQLRARGFHDWEREFMFAADDGWEARRWRADFANKRLRLLIEVEGLVVRMVRDINSGKPMRIVTGRHATITGMREDFNKYAAAEILGWHVIRVEQDMIRSGEAIAFVERFEAARAHAAGTAVKRRKVKR